MTPSGQEPWDAPDDTLQSFEHQTTEQSALEVEQVAPESEAASAESDSASSDHKKVTGETSQEVTSSQPSDGAQALSWRGTRYAISTTDGAEGDQLLSDDWKGAQPLSWRGVSYPGTKMGDRDYLQRLEAMADAGLVPANKPPNKGLSIRIKTTVLAAIFGALPVVVVSTIAYRAADSTMTQSITRQELEEVDQIAASLQQYMQERLANIKTVASIVNAFPVFTDDLGEEAKALLKEDLADELTQLVENYGTYNSIGVFDLQGQLIVQSSGSALPSSQFEADYFQQVLKTGRPTASEPISGASLGEQQPLSIYVAAPIVGASGNTEAVVAAQIPADFIGNTILSSAISATEEEAESEFYRLVDSSGNIIQSLPLDPDKPDIGTPIIEAIPDFEVLEEQRQQQVWIGPTSQGRALNAYAPVSGLGNLTWSVVNSNPVEDVFAPQRQLLQALILGSAITALVAALMGVLLARRAIQPIEQVTETVERLGQGQLDTRVSVKGDDELAILGANVNRMAGQIQILLQTLRQNAALLGRQTDVLASLARHEALVQGDAAGAAKAFTEATARTLNLERISVWTYEREPSALVCLAEYQLSADQHNSGALLITEQFPEYFEAISQMQMLAIEQINRDPMVQELATRNLLATDTVSLLEIPIQVGGNFVGSLRCEHKGQPREWRAEERTFVSSVANLLALALESDFMQGEVGHLLDVVSAVEDGNLTIQARVSDRTTGLVADTFNRLIERLSEVLHQAIETTQLVAVSANQQKSQASLIAANAERQSDGVTQVLQLTAQVDTLARETADRVDISRASLQTLQKTVEEGQLVMANLTAGIDILQDGSDRIIQQMKTLGEFVGLADQFVQDQTQIASLTQTLAINASLVAARAAEQRDPQQFAMAAREFSAIANQVGQLAQQTNTSLTTLEQRSAQIQRVVFTVDTNVQKVGSLVEDFTRGVEQSNQVFDDVKTVTVDAVNAEAVVAEASQAIMAAVQSAANVARVITDMTAQTTELTQQNRLQSGQMEILAKQLLDTMVFFQLPPVATTDQNQPNASAHANQNTVAIASQALPYYPAAADSV